MLNDMYLLHSYFKLILYRKAKIKRQKERAEEEETKTISGSLTGTVRSMHSFGSVSHSVYHDSDDEDGMENIEF